MAGPELDDPDDLYRVDPGEFVAARGALAKRLRAEGRRDDAAAVAKLRKPSATAWALNQVARDEPELVERALASGARLREATDAAVAGDAATLRAATAEDREASDAVVDAAATRLGGRGHAARPLLAATLRAAVLDDAVADELRRGVLAVDHDAAGFGFGFGFDSDAAGAPAPPRTRTPTKPKGSSVTKATTGPRAHEDDLAEKRRQREAAQEEETRAREERRRRADQEADAARLAKRAERLDRDATRAEEEARRARTAAEDAAKDADAARQALDGQ